MQSRTPTKQQAFEILLLENNLRDAELVMQALKESNIHKNILHVSEKNGFIPCIDDAVTCYGYLPFRLIILNLEPPSFSEIELLNIIRANPATSSVPVILTSSVAPAHLIFQSYRLGINSFLVKPSEIASLASDLQHLEVHKLLEDTLN